MWSTIPTMAQIHELTMIELAAAIRAGELSPVAVTDHYLRRTTELNDQVGAFYTITPEFAADQARAAQGSEGGGSIRIPSSVCGLFGIKPTRGRVSEGPLVPDLYGLGVNGPLARTVADAALLLDVMAGNFPGDMYTQPPLPAGETFLGYASRRSGERRVGEGG